MSRWVPNFPIFGQGGTAEGASYCKELTIRQGSGCLVATCNVQITPPAERIGISVVQTCSFGI